MCIFDMVSKFVYLRRIYLMLEIDGKSYEVHKVKLTKKDLKNLKKGEALIFICKEDNKAIIICMEDKE